MLIAITRPVSASLEKCELTHLSRTPLDVRRAAVQHAAYETLLEMLGATLVRVPAADALPDAVFVEDIAVVLEEIAVIARPGAESRRPETAGVAAALAPYRQLLYLQAPATLDGGDVLRVGRTLFVGRTARTNDAGIAALRAVLTPFDYRVEAVEVTGCLHLKSAATCVREASDPLLLINPAWLRDGGRTLAAACDRLEVDPREAYAANGLPVGRTLIYPDHFPLTLQRLRKRGLRVKTLACDELAKAEGAVTCCSIVFAR